MQWDIFCRVIDNFGDLGVCWRLSADLGERGHRVRLWVDDPAGLQWMAPGAVDGQWPNIQVFDWEQSKRPHLLAALTPADVWIEAFGCELATEFVDWRVRSSGPDDPSGHQRPVWINLEYLSAESFVERCHGLPSPVMSGPAKGWAKHFFYPGFTAGTGGLLREPGLLQRQRQLATDAQRGQWLLRHGIAWHGESLVSMFCYGPAALPSVLAQLDAHSLPMHLLVTAGRAAAAVQAAVAGANWQNLRITYLPALTQNQYDELLSVCDLNFVRGEDSLVRALWAGKPLVWNIYPQEDDAHIAKLQAFLDVMGATAPWRGFHAAWNGLPTQGAPTALPLADLQSWSQTVQGVRRALAQRDDLLTQLLQFVLKKR